jgi:hypothetical protein
MLNICILKHKEQYRAFSVRGHAGYAEAGSDIVCAAVSVLTIHTVNAIETLTDAKLEYMEEDGLVDVNFLDSLPHEAQLFMDAYVSSLKQTIQAYGKQYIHLEIREV